MVAVVLAPSETFVPRPSPTPITMAPGKSHGTVVIAFGCVLESMCVRVLRVAFSSSTCSWTFEKYQKPQLVRVTGSP